MFRNSRNQTPCQVPVASFPFDIGILTLAPIRDDLICAYQIAESAMCPSVIELRPKITGISSLPSASCLYTPFPAAHATRQKRLRNSFISAIRSASSSSRSKIPTHLYLLSLSRPTHRSYPPAHRRPNSHSSTVHSSCAAGKGAGVRILCRISGEERKQCDL